MKKTWLITGCSGGFGLQLAQAAARGNAVLATARDPNTLLELMGTIEESTPEEYRSLFDVNVLGLIETTRAA